MQYYASGAGPSGAPNAQRAPEPAAPSQDPDDDDEEFTEEEKDRQAQRCLWVCTAEHAFAPVFRVLYADLAARPCYSQVTNILLMLVGAGCFGFGMYAGFKGYGGAWPAFVDGGIGVFLFVICFLGLIGALRINRSMLRLVCAEGWC